MPGALDALTPDQSVIWFANPGLGHPNLKEGWKDSLQLLKTAYQGFPVFCTSNSEKDQARDKAALAESLPDVDWLIGPRRNTAFVSRKALLDPVEVGEVVQANWGMMGFKA